MASPPATKSDPERARQTRRHFIGAAVSGAFLGSAWAITLRETSGSRSEPTLTLARNDADLAGLFEYQGRRVLLVDCASENAVRDLAELVTGFLRQRIDILLATSGTLGNLPPDFRERWRTTVIRVIPAHGSHPQLSLGDRELRVGELSLTADRVAPGAWQADTPSQQSAWHLTASFGASRIVVVSDAIALDHLAPTPGHATVVVCADGNLKRIPSSLAADAIVVSDTAEVFENRTLLERDRLIPFRTLSPMTLRLTDRAIEMAAAL